jgi:hypothetical protein
VSADRPNRHLTVKGATTMVFVGADVHKRDVPLAPWPITAPPIAVGNCSGP